MNAKDYRVTADEANQMPLRTEFSAIMQAARKAASAGAYDYVLGGLFSYSETTAELIKLGFTVTVTGSSSNIQTTVSW